MAGGGLGRVGGGWDNGRRGFLELLRGSARLMGWLSTVDMAAVREFVASRK